MALKQVFCVHWFDPTTTIVVGESSGAIVCLEQKTWAVTLEGRTCSKCGLTERRETGREYLGWQ